MSRNMIVELERLGEIVLQEPGLIVGQFREVRLRRLRLIEYRLLLGRVGCGLREAGDAYPFAIRVRVASRASLVIVDGTPRVLLVDHIDELLRYRSEERSVGKECVSKGRSR